MEKGTIEMFGFSKQEQRKEINHPVAYPVMLFLTIRSEAEGEIGLPLYEIHYNKITDLVIPPSIGISISGLWQPVEIVKIIAGSEGFYTRCFFETIVIPPKRFDSILKKHEEYLMDDQWSKETSSIDPRIKD